MHRSFINKVCAGDRVDDASGGRGRGGGAQLHRLDVIVKAGKNIENEEEMRPWGITPNTELLLKLYKKLTNVSDICR
jgi:hypothetical protein